LTVDGDRSSKYAVDCPNRKTRKPAKASTVERVWMAEIPMWITVSAVVDHYETRELA
jgi:hypothetical protein